MIHLRFDWRRRILYPVAGLIFFLGSETIGNKKRDIHNEMARGKINNADSADHSKRETDIGNNLTVYLTRQ